MFTKLKHKSFEEKVELMLAVSTICVVIATCAAVISVARECFL